VVPPKLNAINKKFLRDAHRKRKPASLCQVRRSKAVIPLLYNGSARIGLLVLGGETPPLHVRPFNSEVHSTSALLPRLHRVGLDTFVLDQRLGSLEIALKCTRPRQRFWLYVGRDFMTEGGGCQEESISIVSLEYYFLHSAYRIPFKSSARIMVSRSGRDLRE
jgi:hypothetical protein